MSTGVGIGGTNVKGQQNPGFISPFDMHAFGMAQQAMTEAMTNRYAQLGLGATGATPAGAATGITPIHAGANAGGGGFAGGGGSSGGGGATGGWSVNPGSGTTPVNPGNMGAGSTAEQMDLGNMPSLVGGIPAEIQAGLGEVQTQDLSMTSTAGQGGGGKGGGAGSLLGLAAKGGK